MSDFKNKVVIVTGAGHGIGREIALSYGEKGAHVVIADVNEENSYVTKQLLAERGGQAYVIGCDVSKPEEIETVMKQTAQQFGTIDILINNAGLSRWKSPYELSVDEWDQIMNTNLRAVFLCAREAAKVMRANSGGTIINIASTRALMSEPNSEAYAATKGGMVSLTHALAASFQDDRIRVNAISPGWIETDDESQLRPADHEQHFSKRVGKPRDIANACLYVSSPNNEFINGTNLVIDGGMTKKMIYEE